MYMWCVVCCVVWVHEGVVLCDELCDELFGVLRGGGVVWCVVCGCFISLSLSLFLSILFFLFLALSFLFFPSSVLSSSFSSSSFSSLFPSRQQTQH